VRDLVGARVEEIESLTSEHALELKGAGEFASVPAHMSVWRDLLVAETADVLYSYQDQFYGDYAAVTKNTFGEGVVYYIGGGIDGTALDVIAKKVVERHSIDYIESDEDVEVYRRHAEDSSYLFVMNHSDQKKQHGAIELQPYESKIVKE
ncbi:beta-galactosidase trimerization domain-containing protein, partial [Halobacillus sp. BBL2006]|uniref:beta-galactosidase trimerization domain-containing protein n=1 Tax=Halobacillus sp. BBL2006 TaxID=1543706 RepID=UPI00054314F0